MALKNIHHHVHHALRRGMVHIAAEHPLLLGGIALAGAYVGLKKLTASPVNSVPQNPAPQKLPPAGA